jgi:hypothetical protein
MPAKEINKPNLNRRYFWDTIYESIDWQEGYQWIIARIIERGNKEDWEELIRFYGREKVINALKNEIPFLADYAIEDVCHYFTIKKEEILCYIRKQSRPGHWI